jgi:hypothetical protein
VGLSRIFYDHQFVATSYVQQWVHIRRTPIKVDRNYRPYSPIAGRSRPSVPINDHIFDTVRVQVVGSHIDVDKNGGGPNLLNGFRGGEERVGTRHNCIARTNTTCLECKPKSRRTGRHSYGLAHPYVIGESPLEIRNFIAQYEARMGQNPLNRSIDLWLDQSVLGL